MAHLVYIVPCAHHMIISDRYCSRTATGMRSCARVTRAASLREGGSSFAMRLLIRRCHSSSLHLLNEQREGEGRRGAGEREGVSGQISFSPSLTRMHSVRPSVRPSERASERAEPDTESGVHAPPRPDPDSSLPGEDWVT